MAKNELTEKYQISAGEFRAIEKAFDAFVYDLWYYSSTFSIPKIREYEEGTKEKERYDSEQKQAKKEHQSKGFLGRSLTTPRPVNQNFALISSLERAREHAHGLKGKEEAFEYICKAHRLNSKSVFRDIMVIKGSEQKADAFRAYEYAKTSDAFKGIF